MNSRCIIVTKIFFILFTLTTNINSMFTFLIFLTSEHKLILLFTPLNGGGGYFQMQFV